MKREEGLKVKIDVRAEKEQEQQVVKGDKSR